MFATTYLEEVAKTEIPYPSDIDERLSGKIQIIGGDTNKSE
jgi:hypothetical protein